MTPLLREAYAEAAIRSRRLGRVEVPGRVPLAGSPHQSQHEQAACVDAAILRALETRPMLVSELARATGLSAKIVSGAMQRQKLRGWATSKSCRVGNTGGIPQRYTITPEGRTFATEAQTRSAQREDTVLAPVAAPEPESPPAGKSEWLRAGVIVPHPMSNEARKARVTLANGVTK